MHFCLCKTAQREQKVIVRTANLCMQLTPASIHTAPTSCLFMTYNCFRPMLDFKAASTTALSTRARLLLFIFAQLWIHITQASATYRKLTCQSCHQMSKHHHITPILKSLHWLKIQEWIHLDILSLTSNSLCNTPSQIIFVNFSSSSSTQSSSSLSFSWPLVTTHLKLGA